MYVIVIGGGKVGYYLSKHLIERGYEVTLIEKDPRRAEVLTSQLGGVVMVGDGDEMAFLATTGMERADVVVAVTGDDEDNLIACQMAKRKFDVPRTVARVNNPSNVRIFKTLGVDVALSATEVLLDLLERELPRSPPSGRPAPSRTRSARPLDWTERKKRPARGLARGFRGLRVTLGCRSCRSWCRRSGMSRWWPACHSSS